MEGHVRLSHRQIAGLVTVAVAAVGFYISGYVFIDGGNDDLKSTMLEQFELSARGDATANDDLNYRLGIHRGMTIGSALCGMQGANIPVEELGKLLQEGT